MHEVAIVRDKPADEDSFGSHSRVAEAIEKLIQSDSEARIIGLLGSWGSGKSTVLKLTEQRLKSHDSKKFKSYFFVFDAWLHQNDPPRRSFIEAFLTYLDSEELTDRGKWGRELDRLSRRSETHEIQTTPTLTIWGMLIAASILLLPLGYTFLAKTDKSFHKIGWAIASLPILIGVLNYLFWRKTWRFWSKEFWKVDNWIKNKAPFEDRNILSLFVNKSTDKVTNRIIKTPDPTSIEFRETFDSIMNDVSAPDRRFVFVLDNLDRIPEEDAANHWATVRNFFFDRSSEFVVHSSAQSVRPPWVILPLDPDAAEKIHATRHSGADVRERMQAFIEKTFDTVLHLGPPVTSDWQDYLHQRLKKAFGPIASSERIYQATKIYDAVLLSSDQGVRVTPRKLNNFVNRIAALWLQWEDELPFPSLAYHAILADHTSIDIQKILDTDGPIGSVMKRMDSDWQKNIAAIHYGVEPAKALQLLLEPEINESISIGNEEKFDRLASVPGFDVVLEYVVESTLAGEFSNSFVINCAAMLETVSRSSERISVIWSLLVESVESFNEWEELPSANQNGLSALIKHGGDQTSRLLIESLGAVSTSATSQGQGAVGWLSCVLACFEAAEQQPQDIIEDSIAIPGDAGFYLSAVRIAHNDGLVKKYPEIIGLLRTSAEPQDIVTNLVDVAKKHEFRAKPVDYITIFHSIRTVRDDLDWSPLAEAAEQIAKETTYKTGLGEAIEILITLESKDVVKLGVLCNQGFLAHHIHSAHDKNDLKSIAAILLAFMNANPSVQANSHQGQSQSGYPLIQNLEDNFSDNLDSIASEISDIAFRSGNAKNINAIIDAAKLKPIWKKILSLFFKDRLKKDNLGRLYIDKLLDSMDFLLGFIDSKMVSDLVTKLSNYQTFWNCFEELEDGLFFILSKGLVGDTSDRGQRARALARTRFENKEADWWATQLNEESEALLLLGKILQQDEALDLGEQYALGLERHAKATLLDDDIKLEASSTWQSLPLAMSEIRRTRFFRNLLEWMRDSENAAGIATVLSMYGNVLLASKIVLEEPDRNSRQILLPMLSSSDQNAISAVVKLNGQLAPVVGGSAKSTKKEIKEKIESLYDSDLEKNLIEQLATLPEEWNLGKFKKNGFSRNLDN